MTEGLQRIPLTDAKRKEIESKKAEYRSRLAFNPDYAPPDMRGESYTWYGYIMAMILLDKGYFDAAEIRKSVENTVGRYFVEQHFDNRVAVFIDYLLNDGKNTERR